MKYDIRSLFLLIHSQKKCQFSRLLLSRFLVLILHLIMHTYMNPIYLIVVLRKSHISMTIFLIFLSRSFHQSELMAHNPLQIITAFRDFVLENHISLKSEYFNRNIVSLCNSFFIDLRKISETDTNWKQKCVNFIFSLQDFLSYQFVVIAKSSLA